MRSPPQGAFTLTLPPPKKDDGRALKREYPLAAGNPTEMGAWIAAIVGASAVHDPAGS